MTFPGTFTWQTLCLLCSIMLSAKSFSTAVESVKKSFSQLKNSGVYTCTISFPLDSVGFSFELVDECLTGIEKSKVSYIHVFATASQTGTQVHNLYLSTRRAGAIEGYLKRLFPETEIHAFGGGINPKFGKAARIFVVVGDDPGSEKVQLASNLTPLEIKTFEPTKEVVIWKERPKTGYVLVPYLGIANFDNGVFAQSQEMQISKQLREFVSLGNFDVGLSYQLLRTNLAIDTHVYKGSAGYKIPLLKILDQYAVHFKARCSLGLARARKFAGDYAILASMGYGVGMFDFDVYAARHQKFSDFGFSLSAEI